MILCSFSVRKYPNLVILVCDIVISNRTPLKKGDLKKHFYSSIAFPSNSLQKAT